MTDPGTARSRETGLTGIRLRSGIGIPLGIGHSPGGVSGLESASRLGSGTPLRLVSRLVQPLPLGLIGGEMELPALSSPPMMTGTSGGSKQIPGRIPIAGRRLILSGTPIPGGRPIPGERSTPLGSVSRLGSSPRQVSVFHLRSASYRALISHLVWVSHYRKNLTSWAVAMVARG